MADDAQEVLSLEAAKRHLRVTGAGEDDDIAMMTAAAIGAVESFLGRTLIGADGWPSAGELPANVIHAVKLVLTALYDDRTAPVPEDALRSLVGRFCRVSFG